MIYQMVSSFDNPEFVKAIQKNNSVDPEDSVNTFYMALGKGMYVIHLVEMNYLNSLKEVKQKIEDYWSGSFVDEWGRKLDEMYLEEDDHESCEKDFHTYLKWKFSNEDQTDVCEKADISPLILSFWETNTTIKGALMSGLVSFLNPTIFSPSADGQMKEMSDAEKQNYSLNQKIKQMEDSFHLIQYRDLCELAIKIADSKSDPKKLYNLL
jgi:hypothetical protein